MSVNDYGIRVPFDGSYLWVTYEGQKPVLFASIEEATVAASIWGPLAKVERYITEEYE